MAPRTPSLILYAQELRGLDIFNGAGGIPCSLCHEVHAATNVWQANNGLDLVPLDPGTTVPALRRIGGCIPGRVASKYCAYCALYARRPLRYIALGNRPL
jgi:hypothetical protein